jgi:hypothetical protein
MDSGNPRQCAVFAISLKGTNGSHLSQPRTTWTNAKIPMLANLLLRSGRTETSPRDRKTTKVSRRGVSDFLEKKFAGSRPGKPFYVLSETIDLDRHSAAISHKVTTDCPTAPAPHAKSFKPMACVEI